MAESSVNVVLDLLKKKFPSYVFESSSPKYVKALHPYFTEGIHCYLLVDNHLPIESLSLYDRINDDDSVSEVTEISGNPLPAHFESLDVSISDRQLGRPDPYLSCRYPVDNNVARQIINYCSLDVNAKVEISVLTKGQSFKKVVMGFYKEPGLVRTWWTDVLMDTPSAEDMLNMHKQVAGPMATVVAHVRWTRVLKSGSSNVELHVERKELTLSPPNDPKTAASLQLDVCPGNHPALASIWKQLELLKIAVDLLHQPDVADSAEWTGVQGLLGRTELARDLRFRHFLALRAKPAKFDCPKTEVVTAAIDFAARYLGPLDYAWLLLAESHGAQDLRKLIECLFSATEAARREGRPVVADATSGSRFAATLAGAGGFPPRPIEILAELGCLKLRRELCEILKALVGPTVQSIPPLTAPGDLLLWLFRTAATVEMLSRIDECVKQEFLSHIATKTLMVDLMGPKSQITAPWKLEDPPKLTVQLPVPMSQVKYSHQLHEIKVKLSTSQSKSSVITTFISGNLNLLPPASLYCLESNMNNSVITPVAHCLRMTVKELQLFSR